MNQSAMDEPKIFAVDELTMFANLGAISDKSDAYENKG